MINPGEYPRLLRRGAIVLAGILVAVAVAVGPAQLIGDYYSFLLVAIGAYAIAVLVLTMLAGLSGIWSMGHAAFTAIGAYLVVNLAPYGAPLEGIILLSLAGSFGVGYVLGLSAGRFSILYFGLLTLALSLTTVEIIWHWESATGGDEGIAVPPVPLFLLGRSLTITDGPVLTVMLAMMAYLAVDLISDSVIGRRWLAIKGQRTASMSIGIVPHRQNALAMAASAAIASLSGVCTAVAVGYLDPGSFGLNTGILLIVAAVVGGVGSSLGALLGAAFIVLMPELARDVPDVSAFVFGLVTITTLLFLRRGIVPTLATLMSRLLGVGKSGRPARADARDLMPADRGESIANLLSPATLPLTVEDLTVKFGEVTALDKVSLSVSPDKTLGLIGPNGAGKTTLLNVLNGYVRSTSVTRLSIGDANLADLEPYDQIGVGLGRSFQHAELFEELTVRETFLVAASQSARAASRGTRLPGPDEIADLVTAALNLDHIRDANPAELSFGTRKLVDIGRILSIGASIVLLDEPFSELDSNETSELRTVLKRMQTCGISIVLIDHAVKEVFDLADEVVVLDFGRLLARGTPAEVSRNEAVQRAYFGGAVEPNMASEVVA